jgi:hypothetical protein
VSAAPSVLRRTLARRAERRRLADWAWQRETLVLAQLTADVHMAISAVHVANLLGASVPDVGELLAGLVDQGFADLTFGGPRNQDGSRAQGTRYYLTDEGLAERYRRCGR